MADSDNTVTPAAAEQAATAGPQPVGPPPITGVGVMAPSYSDILKKTHAETAKTLSFWLVGILAGTVLLHYICVMILVLFGKDYELPIIEDVLHVWLPVLAGLAGSAATYYFTRDKW